MGYEIFPEVLNMMKEEGIPDFFKICPTCKKHTLFLLSHYDFNKNEMSKEKACPKCNLSKI